MKYYRKILIVLILAISIISCENETPTRNTEKTELIKKVFAVAEAQYTDLIKKIENDKPLLQPRSVNKDGTLRMAWREDWTSGFFPGTLWYIYEYTKDDKWKANAEKFTEALDSAQFVTWHHDVGFMIEDSYGQGYRLTGNEEYRQAVIDAAKSLSTRYRPKAKIIQSWDTDASWIEGRGWDMPVIIDNMMNLKLLYQATKYTKDTSYAHIANMHATETMKNQYRENYSCFHLVNYDSKTGVALNQVNFQGFSDESSWARGQAWGFYGFLETYMETGNKKFLTQAKNIASYIINSKEIPADHIPYWDYNAPDIPNAPRDASSAAITASAMLDLAKIETDEKIKNIYLDYGVGILKELSSERYLAKVGENGGFILMHSVGNIHENNETDAPLNYADYYFVEALLKWKSMK